MTDREKAIVMAYTGTCILAGDKLGIYCQYIQEKLGHCVMTHELAYPEVQDAIREATKDDFIELCRASDEPRVMTLEEVEDAIDTVVWVDKPTAKNESKLFGLIQAYSRKFKFIQIKHIEMNMGEHMLYPYETYGKEWRCWASRPTDEVRRTTPWE